MRCRITRRRGSLCSRAVLARLTFAPPHAFGVQIRTHFIESSTLAREGVTGRLFSARIAPFELIARILFVQEQTTGAEATAVAHRASFDPGRPADRKVPTGEMAYTDSEETTTPHLAELETERSAAARKKSLTANVIPLLACFALGVAVGVRLARRAD